jgi:hypothetical protein
MTKQQTIKGNIEMNYKQMMADYTTKPTDDLGISKLSPSQLDNVKQQGSLAENLINNNDLKSFINWYRFNLLNELTSIQGFTEEHNAKRLALTHSIAGIEGFTAYLQKLVERKNKVVSIAPSNI